MTYLLGGGHLWLGPVSAGVDGWKCFNFNNNVGQDCQHHRLMVSGTFCCVVEFVYADTMVTGFAGLSVCTEECGTHNLKISQMA